jgi:glycosyltransferase involved in cell wall biosynthesis
MVSSSYPKCPGDATAPFIEAIAGGVAARGHDVEVILPEHPELARPPGEPVTIRTYRYAPLASWCVWGYAQSMEADVRLRPGTYLLAPFVALSLRNSVSQALSSRRYDALHAHWVVPNASLIADIARAHRVPFVVSLHGSDVAVAERLLPARILARAAFRAAGMVTACSSDLRRRACALGALRERTRVVPYGVDAEAFSPRPSSSGWRGRLGAGPEQTLVVAVGRLVEKKGFRHLVEAAARVEGLHVAILGDGDLEHALTSLAQGRRASVRFVGRVERGTVADALAAADVVAVPSVVDSSGNVDGLPNVLLEAMAAGQAIVASRVAGIPDVVEDGVSGLLVPPGDVEALAQGLRRLKASVDLRRALGGAARRAVEERLTWPAAARAFEECYVQAAALDAR